MAVLEGAALAAATAEVKAYLRVVTSQEDELIGRLVASATGLCEAFTGRWLMSRAATEMLPAGPGWQRLRATPVRAITGVDVVGQDGTEMPLPASAYAIDIDGDACGWVRVMDGSGSRRVRVRFEAGSAENWASLPEPLRQGVIRLAGHLYTHRTGSTDDEPPLAVTAMWRLWRRLSIGGDVLVMRAGPGQLHLGIWTGGGLVHADAGLGRVVERPGPPPWPRLSIWRVKGEG